MSISDTLCVLAAGCAHVAPGREVANDPLPAAAVAAAPARTPPAEPADLPPHRTLPDVAAALDVVLASNHRILAVGEIHAKEGGPNVPTTLSVFTREVFPVLAPHLTDLVLETWRVDGTCGEQAATVTAQVEAETRRPVAIKDDLTILVETAVAAQVRPHDLVFSCQEFASLHDPAGEVVYANLLGLLTHKLEDYAVLAARTPGATLVLYGGAVHNDLAPKPDLAAYSYGPAARAAAGAAFVELDLYQPELVSGALAEPEWAPLMAITGPDRVVLYDRGEGSWVLLLPTAD